MTDIRTKLIPNKLTGPLMVVGIVGNSLLADGIGFQAAFIGWFLAFVVHFTLNAIGLEGAGDGKLMMGVGAFLGWETMIEATLWRYVVLLPYAVIALTVMQRWWAFREAVAWTGKTITGQEAGERPPAMELPFGPVIAFVVPIAMQTDWLVLWR